MISSGGVQIETAPSLKVVLDNWNIQTQAWLKYVCYDRVKTWRVTQTMLLSAIWCDRLAFLYSCERIHMLVHRHGIYPGYFFSFGSAALATEASRKVTDV